MNRYNLIIGGKSVVGAMTLGVINPATEEVFASCARADVNQLEEAVASARAAFADWSAIGIVARRHMLLAIADGLEANSARFAAILTAEQGKPLDHASFEIAASVALLRAFAAMGITARIIREDADTKVIEHRTPLGVIAAIMPWNFPLFILMAKVAPALLAGNTVVAKPAPTTPLTTLMFGELCLDHLPPGVLNVIVDDNDLGGRLSSHPDIAKVAFTGSTVTGRKVMASVADTLKRLTLELGGNDPAIILPDVDPKAVAGNIFAAAMANAGQVCIAIKRVYAHSSIYDALCEEMARLARDHVVDNGARQGSQMGPVQNRAQYDKVRGFIEQARADGTIIAGGSCLSGPGYFIAPTIVRDIADDAQLVREEQFGPILPILRYDDLDDAVARANRTEYGLGASIWSTDTALATDIAMRLTSGTVWVNKHLDLPPDLPLRGARQSGFGAELGQEGLEEFTQAHIVNIAKARLAAVS